MAQRAIEVKIAQSNIVPIALLPAVRPWILPDATVDSTLLKWKNKDQESMQNSFIIQEYIDRHHSYVQIDTDASKTLVNKVILAFIVRVPLQSRKRINNEVSIYMGEILALLLAVQWVENTRPLRTIICSDMSSALNSLQHSHSDSRLDILIEIRHYTERDNKACHDKL